MATICARRQADGSTRYTAIVRTFAHRAAAVTWAKHREVVLEDPSACRTERACAGQERRTNTR